MGRAPALTDREKSAILAYRQEGLKPAEIALRLDRSRNAIQTFLKTPDKAHGNSGNQHARKFKIGAKNRVINKLKRSPESPARALADSANAARSQRKPVSPETVRRNMHQDLVFRRAQPTQPLTRSAKDKRVEFALANLNKFEDHRKLVFTDEKKFSLDGPDGYSGRWIQRGEKSVRISRHSGGGNVLYWMAISSAGKLCLLRMPSPLNQDKYIEFLTNNRVKLAVDEFHPNGWTLVQDNAPAHRGKKTQTFFQTNQWNVLAWPAWSPDLNPVENMWSILSRRVYEGNRQYSSITDLVAGIESSWNCIAAEEATKLVDGWNERLVKCIKMAGNNIQNTQ